MAGLSYDVLRVGKKYKLINFGERFEFEILEIMGRGNFRLKDIHTLEIIFMNDLTKFGKGKDFEIREIEIEWSLLLKKLSLIFSTIKIKRATLPNKFYPI